LTPLSLPKGRLEILNLDWKQSTKPLLGGVGEAKM